MKAEEFRIGNTISYTNDNGTFTLEIKEILRKGVLVNYNGGEWFIVYDEIQPIPLTEEWLLKFGFDKEEDYDFKTTSRGYRSTDNVPLYVMAEDMSFISIMFSGGRYWYVTRVYDGGTSDPHEPFIEIKYVHKLQNLFYALTRSELKINK